MRRSSRLCALALLVVALVVPRVGHTGTIQGITFDRDTVAGLGTTVFLFGFTQTQTGPPNFSYSFGNLAAGTYTVSPNPPPGYGRLEYSVCTNAVGLCHTESTWLVSHNLTVSVSVPATGYVDLWFRFIPDTSIVFDFDSLPANQEMPLAFPAVGTSPVATTTTQGARSTFNSMEILGSDTSTTTSYAYFKLADVDIPVGPHTRLEYYIRPETPLGRFVAVDLVMNDGSVLRDSGAVDQDGVRMHPALQGLDGGRFPMDRYSRVVSRIGQVMSGKRIRQILLAYDHPAQTGFFNCIIDDIRIFDLPVTTRQYVEARNLVVIYPQAYFPYLSGGYAAQDARDKRNGQAVTRIEPPALSTTGDAPAGTFFYPDYYSVRWTGGLNITTAGTYQFSLGTDQDANAELYVDNTRILRKTVLGGPAITASVSLSVGRHAFRVDYVDYFGDSNLTVRWAPPGQGFGPIPPAQLFSTQTGGTSGGLTGTYYPTLIFVDSIQQITKLYADMQNWIWRNSDQRLNPTFDVRVITQPMSLERYGASGADFMYPDNTDSEGRSVNRDIRNILGLNPATYASVVAWSVPLNAADSHGVQRGFFAAGATIGGIPTYSSIQTQWPSADITEFGLRVDHWFDGLPFGQDTIYPFNHDFNEFSARIADGLGDDLFFASHAVSYRSLNLADWRLPIPNRPGITLQTVNDSDEDGIPDPGANVPVTEATFGTNANVPDTDGDGMTDAAELTNGFKLSTNPNVRDTDGDGRIDRLDPTPRFPIAENRPNLTPTRDGVITAGEYGAALGTVSDPASPSNLSATVYATWSTAGLNVAFDVTDDQIDPPDGTTPEFFTYGGDNVRVRVDFTNDGYDRQPTSGADNVEIGVQPAGAQTNPIRFASLHRFDPTGASENYTAIPAVPAAWRTRAGGYVVELLIPASATYAFTPAACKTLAFYAEIYDRDNDNTSGQLRYQLFREGALTLPHHDVPSSPTFDFVTVAGMGGRGAFVPLTLTTTAGQACNHAPTVEAIANQTVVVGRPFRLQIRGADIDRDRLQMSARLSTGPLGDVGMSFDDRGVNMGVLRWTPSAAGTYSVTVDAMDPSGAVGARTFTVTAQ